jgi:hypothetical protein
MAFMIYSFVTQGSILQQLSVLPTIGLSVLILRQPDWKKVFSGYLLFHFGLVIGMACIAEGGFLWPLIPAMDISCRTNIHASRRYISPFSNKDNTTQVVIVGNGPRYVVLALLSVHLFRICCCEAFCSKD